MFDDPLPFESSMPPSRVVTTYSLLTAYSNATSYSSARKFFSAQLVWLVAWKQEHLINSTWAMHCGGHSGIARTGRNSFVQNVIRVKRLCGKFEIL